MTLYQKILSVVGMLRSSINQKAAKSELAATFNPSKSYEQGRLVIYEGRLYRCVAPHLGPWNDSDFQLSTVDGAIAAGGVDQVQADWNELDDTEPSFIRNKPVLAEVATTGSYEDLEDKPTIPPETEIDDELNVESENPVQNKVITEEIDDLGRSISDLNDKFSENIAPVFSESESYSEDDLVWYEEILYRCIATHSAGAWNADHFAQTTVSEAIAASGSGGGGSGPSPSDTNPQMDGNAAAGTAPSYSRADHVHPSDTSKANKTDLATEFSNDTPYAAGSLVIKDNTLYRCTEFHLGDWNASHFSTAKVGDVIGAKQYTQGIKYQTDPNNGDATILQFNNNPQYSGNDNDHLVGDVIIPPQIKGQSGIHNVVAIGAGNSYQPKDYENLTSVEAPDSVVTIGANAFARCTTLKCVSVPGVTVINANAFEYCRSLSSIYLPNITRIKQYAFFQCSSLNVVNFGPSMASVPTLDSDNAFSGVSSRCVFVIPDNIYGSWISASNWNTLYSSQNKQYRFVRYSNWASGAGAVDDSLSATSHNPVTNKAVTAALDLKQGKITASGILKGDGNGGVTAAEAGTDYQAPIPAGTYQTPLIAGTDYATPASLNYDIAEVPSDGQLSSRKSLRLLLSSASRSLTLPTPEANKTADFLLDVVNNYSSDATLVLIGTLGTTYNIVVPEGASWSDMRTLASGEIARYYFTLTSLALDDLNTWMVVKRTLSKVTSAS